MTREEYFKCLLRMIVTVAVVKQRELNAIYDEGFDEGYRSAINDQNADEDDIYCEGFDDGYQSALNDQNAQDGESDK